MRRAGSHASLQRHHLGCHPIIRHYLERMNFRGIVRDCLGGGLHQGLDHAEVLSVLVHNILVSRGPMYRVRQWAQRIEPEALGLSAAQVDGLNDDRLVRSLDALVSERGRSVFFRLALRVIKTFRLEVPRVHFDTTTVTFFGQYASSQAEPRISRGHNKDHRPDLKQLLFGLNVASDGAVPLLHHVFSGHRTDDSVHVRNIDELRGLLGRDDFVYVADSKLCTKENLLHIAGHGGYFVTVLPRTRKEDIALRSQLRLGAPAVRWRKFHQIENHRRTGDPPDVFSGTDAGPTLTAEGYRLVWVRSSQKARDDAQARDQQLRKAEVELRALAGKLGTRQLRTQPAANARVQKILAQHRVAAWLKTSIGTTTELHHRYLRPGRPRPGDPVRAVRTRILQLHVTRDRQALRAEARCDGVFPLVTNITKRPRREILEIYKYQPYLEKRFALTKSDYGVAPVFLKKPRRVVALLHLYFVAILLSALLERQVRSVMQRRNIPKIPILPEGRSTATPTTPRILENFADASWHGFQEG
ncbi:MAG: IS1634 family transposase, partial [Acidobacteria bacterium]|nr:IS1634 family transposase [Acidobacteriota bacterium]